MQLNIYFSSLATSIILSDLEIPFSKTKSYHRSFSFSHNERVAKVHFEKCTYKLYGRDFHFQCLNTYILYVCVWCPRVCSTFLSIW